MFVMERDHRIKLDGVKISGVVVELVDNGLLFEEVSRDLPGYSEVLQLRNLVIGYKHAREAARKPNFHRQ